MPGKTLTQVIHIARDQHGFVRAADLRDQGIDPKRLNDYHRRGLADHRGYGLYRLDLIPPGELDEFMEATLWPDGQGHLSHETALDLWGLCDVNPNHIDVTVPRTYRTNRSVPHQYCLHHEDLEEVEQTYLDGLPIVTPTVAIRQSIELRLRPSLVEQAIQTAKAEALVTNAVAEQLLELLRQRRARS